jgi:hypothetical protein
MNTEPFTVPLNYVGQVRPKRMSDRPSQLVNPRLEAFPRVRWSRKGEAVSEAALPDGTEAEENWLDAWAVGGALYSHWLFDVWPKFHLAREMGLKWDKAIVNSAAPAFAQEGLAALDIDPERVTGANRPGGVEVEARWLWRIHETRELLYTPAWVIEAVRAGFLRQGPARGRKLYLSRSGARRRRVIEEDRLVEALVERGFEVVRPETLTLAETAQVMSEAEVVVAPHGAALANLVFCRPPCRVVEFFGWHVSKEFWLLAHQMGLDYACLEARGPDGRAHHELTGVMARDLKARNAADISVDVAEVLRLI